MNPGNALQAAIYTRLVGYSPLTTALGGNRIYDFVPQGAAFPYVLIGDDTLVEWDTKTGRGWEATVTLHAWDYAKAGRKSVKAILSHIDDALARQESTLTGFGLVTLDFEFSETFQENLEGASDRFYHGVIRLRAKIRQP